MFCDTCHWYTRGEPVCPHCGAQQGPEEPVEIIAVPEENMPEPEPPPLPSPPPVPKPVPAPKPLPLSVPTPPPSPPKPAPTPSNSETQSLKALGLILAGAVALIFVLVIVNVAREDNTYNNNAIYLDDYVYNDGTAWPSLEDAWIGDEVFFGDGKWRVLDKEPPDLLLLLLEYEIYLHPGEIDGFLNEPEVNYGDVIHVGGLEFTAEEFGRIELSPEGDVMFLLSPAEMAIYGVEPTEYWDDELVPVRPAMWARIR